MAYARGETDEFVDATAITRRDGSVVSVEDGDVVHITVEDAHTYICQGLLSHNKRCDIKTKVDISDLTDMNLMRDDLADVAYFVKELQETI